MLVADLATLLANHAHDDSFCLHLAPSDEPAAASQGLRDPLLQLCCYDAATALKPLLVRGGRFRSVVLTAGMLAPAALYHRLLGLPSDRATAAEERPPLEPKLGCLLPPSRSLARSRLAQALPVAFPREALRPLVVSRGADQGAMRSGGGGATLAPTVIANYGKLLLECAQCFRRLRVAAPAVLDRS